MSNHGHANANPARVAFAIRICSRRTSRSVRRQSMASHVEDAEEAPAGGGAAGVICFSSYPRFCTLSYDERPVGRGPTFVSGDSRTRIRTITARPSLLPTSQAGTPIDTPRGESSQTREVYRVSTFPFRSTLGQVPAVDREARRTREPTVYDSTDLQYRLVQACQPLSLVNNDGLYRRFRYLHHTSYLALTRLMVARKDRLSRIGPRPSRLERRYIVRAAT